VRVGWDGSRECVVEAGLNKGSLVLFVRGGERLELSRLRALATSHRPDLGVRFCRKFPALTRALPRFIIFDSSQGAPALILASFAVNPIIY
jgi:hypothetical protein